MQVGAVQSKRDALDAGLHLLRTRNQLPFAAVEPLQAALSVLWEDMEAAWARHGSPLRSAAAQVPERAH